MAQTDTQTGTTTIVGVFEDYNAAERASRELAQNGIPQDSVQVQSNFRTGAAGSTGGSYDEGQHEGGFMGWWHSLFNDDEEAASHGGHYAEAIRRGSAVVTVSAAPAYVDRVTEVLNSAGAVDVDERVAGWQQEGFTKHDPAIEPYSHSEATTERERFSSNNEGTRLGGSNEGGTLPVIDEELQIGKRVVQRGGVRVYSKVVERPVTEQVNLREEHVRVERRPADRALAENELSGLRDQSIEVTETAEEAVIGKRARVKEEVVVGKETTERTQQVNETLRHTEVQVDRLNEGGEGNYDTAAVQYGSRIAGESAYRGRNWDEVENDVRSDYTRSNPGGEWDKVKASVRRGWDSITGKR